MLRMFWLGLVLIVVLLPLAGCSKSSPPAAPKVAAVPPGPPPPPPPSAPLTPPPAPAEASPAAPTPAAPPTATAPAAAAEESPPREGAAPTSRRPGKSKSKGGAAAVTRRASSDGGPLPEGALAALVGRSKHPLANAQVGDWAEFRASMPDLGFGGLAPRPQGDIQMTMMVASRTDTTVTLSREGSVPGGRPLHTGGDITFDLTQPWDPAKVALLRDPDDSGKVELIGRTTETVQISDFVVPCEKYQYKLAAGGGELKLQSEVSAWIAAEAPLTGLVGMEMDLLGFKLKMQLVSWGPRYEGTLREVPGAKLVKFEHSRVTFAVGGQSFEMIWPTFGQGPSVVEQGGMEHFGTGAIRYLAPGNVFRVKTVLTSNAEMLGSLVLEQGGRASIAQLVAPLPRDNRNYNNLPQIQPAIWERTLARAKVGDWVVYKEDDNGRSKYREVTGVSPNEVTGWEVYNLEKSFTHALRFKLDEPEPPKAKKTASAPAMKSAPSTKTSTNKSTSKKSSTSKKPTTSKKPAATKKPADDPPKEQPEEKPEPAEPQGPQPSVVATETVTIMGRALSCEVVEVPNKNGRGVAEKLWICAEVPLDGVVRREEKGKLVYLLEEFGQAK